MVVYAQSLGIKAFTPFGLTVNSFEKIRGPVLVLAETSAWILPVSELYFPSVYEFSDSPAIREGHVRNQGS